MHTFAVQDQSFTGVVQAGHKEHAVEVPFDPVALWGREATTFAPGRRGIAVRVRIHEIAFASHIVRRSGRHWLLIPPYAEGAAGLQPGGVAEISLGASDR